MDNILINMLPHTILEKIINETNSEIENDIKLKIKNHIRHNFDKIIGEKIEQEIDFSRTFTKPTNTILIDEYNEISNNIFLDFEKFFHNDMNINNYYDNLINLYNKSGDINYVENEIKNRKFFKINELEKKIGTIRI